VLQSEAEIAKITVHKEDPQEKKYSRERKGAWQAGQRLVLLCRSFSSKELQMPVRENVPFVPAASSYTETFLRLSS